MVAIAGFSAGSIFLAPCGKCTRMFATFPAKQFHFPTGRAACMFVGYPEDWLDRIPATAVESFAASAFRFRADVIRPGDRVLVWARVPVRTLTAARLVGPHGKVFALDMTQAMLAKLRGNAAQADVKNVEVIEGNAGNDPAPRRKRRRGRQRRRQPRAGQAESVRGNHRVLRPEQSCPDRRYRRISAVSESAKANRSCGQNAWSAPWSSRITSACSGRPVLSM